MPEELHAHFLGDGPRILTAWIELILFPGCERKVIYLLYRDRDLEGRASHLIHGSTAKFHCLKACPDKKRKLRVDSRRDMGKLLINAILCTAVMSSLGTLSPGKGLSI